jgi:hypothetical protein
LHRKYLRALKTSVLLKQQHFAIASEAVALELRRCRSSISKSRGPGKMPEKETLRRAREDAEEGKSASTQAGEFVREEIHHVREGKHGARSAKQAIAIGLSKARRAGVKLGQPKPSRTSASTREKAKKDSENSRHPGKTSAKRSRATLRALKKEPRTSASSKALAKQAHSSASRRTRKERSAAGKKAAKTRTRSSAGVSP